MWNFWKDWVHSHILGPLNHCSKLQRLWYCSPLSSWNLDWCEFSWVAGFWAADVAAVAAGGGSEIWSNMLAWCRENKCCVYCRDCWTFLSSTPVLIQKWWNWLFLISIILFIFLRNSRSRRRLEQLVFIQLRSYWRFAADSNTVE